MHGVHLGVGVEAIARVGGRPVRQHAAHDVGGAVLHVGRLPGLALAATWTVEAVAVLSVVFGVTSVNTVRPMDARYQAQRACIAALPAPMLSFDPYLQLPWMYPHGPRFVLAYQYFMERGHRHWFEHDGIGGLLNQGWFASLALPVPMGESFDGGDFSRYDRRPGECAGLKIYIRRQE